VVTAEPAAGELVLLLPLAAAIVTCRPLAPWLQLPEVQGLATSACAAMLQLLAGLGRQHVGLRLLICRIAQRVESQAAGGLRPLLAAVDALAAQPQAGPLLRAGALELVRQLQGDAAGMEAAAEVGPTAGLLAGWASWRSTSLALCAQVYQQAQGQQGLSLAEVQRGQLHRLLAAGLQGGAPGGGYNAGSSHLLRARVHAATLLRMLAAAIKKQHTSAPGGAAAPPDAEGRRSSDSAAGPSGLASASPAPQAPSAAAAAAPPASPFRPAASPLLSRLGASAAATPVRRAPGAGLAAVPSPALPASKLFAALMGQSPAAGSSAPAAQPAAAAPPGPAAAPSGVSPAALRAGQQSPQPWHQVAAQEAAQQAWELYREPLLLLFRVSNSPLQALRRPRPPGSTSRCARLGTDSRCTATSAPCACTHSAALPSPRTSPAAGLHPRRGRQAAGGRGARRGLRRLHARAGAPVGGAAAAGCSGSRGGPARRGGGRRGSGCAAAAEPPPAGSPASELLASCVQQCPSCRCAVPAAGAAVLTDARCLPRPPQACP
jgi:hypothetical protein